MQKIVSAKYIFNGSEILTNTSLVIENSTVKDLIAFDPNHLYIGDGVISHGFVDLQVNGCGGVTFNYDISVSALEVMYQTWRKYGTTKFLPTLITSDEGDIEQALKVVAKWVEQYGLTRGVIGIHIEGPYISVAKKGIHQSQYIRRLDDSTLALIESYANLFPILITVAPESVSDSQVKQLVASGINVSLGHSNASFEDAQSRFLAGASNVTHLFNAMSGISGREPGLIGATLLNNNVYTGIIVDLLHVNSANVCLAKQMKQDKLYLVTDAVMPAGTDIIDFTFAGQQLKVIDNKCVDYNGTLGGAYIVMPQAIKNCLTECKFTLLDTLKMAITNPLNAINIDTNCSRIYSNSDANDLVYLDLNSFSCNYLI